MWGGKFGVKNTKIYGIWNPYIYEKDVSGKTIWAKKFVAYSTNENDYELKDDGTYRLKKNATLMIKNAEDDSDTNYYKIEEGKVIISENEEFETISSIEEIGFVSFICPCDLHEKYMLYCENQVGHYKYYKEDVNTLEDKQKD